jgi:hemoglobin/transferrin/lactoferrin receptor protein
MSVFACASIILFTNSFSAQVQIELYDAYTFQPIEGVSVNANGLIKQSDAKGKVNFEHSIAAIQLNHPDYTTARLEKLSDGVTVRISLVPNTQTMEGTVVSANKFSEKRKDVSQKVQVVRAGDLQFQQQTSMADVMTATGNVFVQKSQLGGGSPIIRGFETNKVLMVVDGVRMNNAIYRGGHLQNILTLDQSMMDRVEVVFGPGSVIYGSDAIGGVMSFTTKSPQLSTSNELLVKGSAYTRLYTASQGYAANAQVNVGTKRFGSLTSFTYSTYGDLRQGANRNAAFGNLGVRSWYVDRINGVDSMLVNLDSNLQIGSAYSQYDVLQKFTFVQKEGVQHKLNFQLSNSGAIDRYDRLTQLSGSKPKYAEWYYGPQFRLMASYTLELSQKTRLYDQARIVVAYQSIEESRMDRKFKKDTRNHRIENLSIVTLNADFVKKSGNHEIRYGLDAYYNDVKSTAFSEDIVTGEHTALDTRYPDGGSMMQGAALYFSHTMELNEKLILTDGLRLSQVSLASSFIDQTFFPFPFSSIKQNHVALNGNLGLIYMPTTKLRVTATGSTGFRAPNVDDLTKVFESVPGNVVVPNPALKSEYAYSGELSLNYNITSKLALGLNAYTTFLTNALTVQAGTFNGADSILYDGQMSLVTTTTNAAKARVYGVEASLNGQLSNHFYVLGTFNYTKGQILTDTVPYPLDHIAPLFGKASIMYTNKKVRSEFYVNYSGAKKLEDYNMVGEDNFAYATANGMPSWYTLNLRLNYTFNQHVSVQAACENLLDQNYRQFASNISAPGRNFIVTLRGNF